MVSTKFDKRFMMVVLTTSRFPLGFDERIVYSTLCYLSRFGHGCREGALDQFCDRSIRVPSALAELVEWGLVSVGKDGCRAVEPAGEKVGWFAWTPGREWHRSLGFVTT